jgi:type IV pilus assembly protein PilW
MNPQMKPVMNRGKNIASQSGVTLVELMIALTISLIIMLGVGTVYLSNKKSFKLQEEFARLQENGRYAVNYMARFVRDAGYAGCASGTVGAITNDLNNPNDVTWNFETGIEGYEYTGTGPNQTYTLSSSNPSPSSSPGSWTAIGSNNPDAAFVDGSADAPIPGSDILVSRSADGNGVRIKQSNNSAQLFLTVTTEEPGACADGSDRISGICVGDELMVSDCKKSIVFDSTAVQKAGSSGNFKLNISHAASGQPGNAVTSWGGANPGPERTFTPGSEVFKISTKVFYVGQGANGPALFVKIGDAPGRELVEGVENMQVLYGEDTDSSGVANHYVSADQVTDFKDVVSVKVSLLLRTIKELGYRESNSTATYALGGFNAATATTINPVDDKRTRKVISSTIRLRNRAFTL